MTLQPLPAFTDNYIWMLHEGQRAVVVDPGEAGPVFEALQAQGLQLDAILVTHHHHDHTGGVHALREATGAQVYGPAHEAQTVVPDAAHRLRQGGVARVLGHDFRVIDVPGHTAGHIAFFCDDVGGSPLLFSGDTLFSGGCGRLLEGTSAQMLASLDALAALPDATRVCCGHEYTLSNLAFAQEVEPGNPALAGYTAHCQRLRAQGLPTLPSPLALEREVNPFLRSRSASVASAVRRHVPHTPHDEVDIFAALRQWKNEFR